MRWTPVRPAPSRPAVEGAEQARLAPSRPAVEGAVQARPRPLAGRAAPPPGQQQHQTPHLTVAEPPAAQAAPLPRRPPHRPPALSAPPRLWRPSGGSAAGPVPPTARPPPATEPMLQGARQAAPLATPAAPRRRVRPPLPAWLPLPGAASGEPGEQEPRSPPLPLQGWRRLETQSLRRFHQPPPTAAPPHQARLRPSPAAPRWRREYAGRRGAVASGMPARRPAAAASKSLAPPPRRLLAPCCDACGAGLWGTPQASLDWTACRPCARWRRRLYLPPAAGPAW